jgi:HAD superfamily hydrolase (TIGR01490 family)
MKKIVIYDVDYTIISINSLSSFMIYYFKVKPSKIIFIPCLFISLILWIFRIISTEKIKSIWLLPFKGISINQLDQISKKFIYQKVIPTIKKEALENINQYKKNGYLIVFASASFEIYIKYIAEYLKADYYFGTKILTNNNKIVPKIHGDNCRGKEKIKRILKSISKDLISKKDSVSYSDSYSDLPFLELVDKFYLIAKKKWKILKTLYN